MFFVESMATDLEPTPEAGAITPGQHRPLPMETQPRSEEGLDNLNVSIHCGESY